MFWSLRSSTMRCSQPWLAHDLISTSPDCPSGSRSCRSRSSLRRATSAASTIRVRDAAGKIAGDLAPDVLDVAGWVSPNPGGVGPMTRAMLLTNVVEAAERRLR